MRKHLKYLTFFVIFLANNANSAYVYLNVPSINFTSPTTNDFIIAEITGDYVTPGFTLNSTPTIDISFTNINITFDVSSPTTIVPFVLDPFDYSVDIGYLSAGYWYITPIFHVDGVFDAQATTSLPLFSVSEVSAVPVPAAIWLFGSGLVGLISVARKGKGHNYKS